MATSTRYDQTTGQVYRQWDVPMPKAQTSQQPWYRIPTYNEWRGPKVDGDAHVPGVESLVRKCIKVVVEHCDELDEDHLQGLPISLVCQIWKHINPSLTLSTHVWKIFAQRISTFEEAEKRCIDTIIRRHTAYVHKTQPLGAYIKPLLSDTLLTHLTITGTVRCDAPELLQLTQLKNLAVLEFLTLDEGVTQWKVSDNIMREWSISPDPFPQLKVLRVWGVDQTTYRSLRYLSSFPSLLVYDVAGEHDKWRGRAADPSWERVDAMWHTMVSYKTLRKQTKILFEFERLAPLTKTIPASASSDMTSQPSAKWRRGNVLSQCQRSSAGNPWGFFLYSYLRSKTSSEGGEFNELLPAHSGSWGTNDKFRGRAIPTQPMINLILGDTQVDPTDCPPSLPSLYHNVKSHGMMPEAFSIRITFFRRDKETANEPEPEPKTQTGGTAAAKLPSDDPLTSRKLRKQKQVVSSILDSFETDTPGGSKSMQ